MKKSSLPTLLLLLVALLLAAGCDDTGPQPSHYTCLKIADQDLTEWNGCDNSSLAVFLFPIEPTVDASYSLAGAWPVKVYVPDNLLTNVLACFSDWEELSMQAFDWLTSGKDYSIIQACVVDIDNPSYTGKIVPQLFFPDETGSYLTIKNPFTGADIIIRNIDYIKFKGSPLLPVPPL